jgi:hypothetical protein
MGHLILQEDNFTWPGFSLLGESSLAITMDDPGPNFQLLDFLVLSGTTSVSIGSSGVTNGVNVLDQLAENNNVLTTVTISGSEPFRNVPLLTKGINSVDGVVTDIAATANSPTTIHSSLKLIDASTTTGGVIVYAGVTNTSGGGQFENGGSLNPNITITYTGLTIKGGSGADLIVNDAKNGIVTDGNGDGDQVVLGGAGAKATLGTGTGDGVFVGITDLLTSEAAGSALGDIVTFGAAPTAGLNVGSGAEAGSTAGTASIGLTKVLNAAAGMEIEFTLGNASSTIVDETLNPAVKSATTLAAAENAAVSAMGTSGVAYFSFHGSEYFIATNNNMETTVSSNDAIVKLVGITDIHHATNAFGLVTLHV